MKRPWMPLYIADYLADTQHLRAAQSGAYLHLIMHYWQAGSLPTDDVLLAAIARMSAAEWRKTKPVLVPFFKDGWRHERIERELIATQEKYERRASAGQRGGNAASVNKQEASNAPALPPAMRYQPHLHLETHQESKISFKGVGAKKVNGWSPPRHGATGKGFTYILQNRDEWGAHAEDYRSVHGDDPLPDPNGGKWFKTLGEGSAA